VYFPDARWLSQGGIVHMTASRLATRDRWLAGIRGPMAGGFKSIFAKHSCMILGPRQNTMLVARLEVHC